MAERNLATRAAHTLHASRAKRSPKSHASVSYETSSKSHASRLQDERFVRDFLQKSRVKSPKRAFRTRLPQKLTCQSLQDERFVQDFLHKSETPRQAQVGTGLDPGTAAPISSHGKKR